MADLPRALVIWRRLLVAALVVAVGAFALWAWSAGDESGGAIGGAGGGDFDTGLTMYDAGERPDAPEVEGTSLDGDELALSDLEGHVVVLNVWGSWCVPCREEAPDLARVARETHDEGVRFLGIDTRDNLAAARAFVRRYDVPYPSLFDQDGQLLLGFNGIIPISAVPSSIVVDPAGKIATRVIGKVDYTTLRGLVDDVLAEQRRDPRRR